MALSPHTDTQQLGREHLQLQDSSIEASKMQIKTLVRGKEGSSTSTRTHKQKAVKSIQMLRSDEQASAHNEASKMLKNGQIAIKSK